MAYTFTLSKNTLQNLENGIGTVIHLKNTSQRHYVNTLDFTKALGLNRRVHSVKENAHTITNQFHYTGTPFKASCNTGYAICTNQSENVYHERLSTLATTFLNSLPGLESRSFGFKIHFLKHFLKYCNLNSSP